MGWKYNAAEVDPLTIARGYDLSTGTGGVRPPAANFATGGNPAQLSTDGVNSTAVATEIYVASVIVPFTCLVTGISLFNGATVGTDNGKVGLFDCNGTLLRASAAVGAVTANADTYQDYAFALDGANTAATTLAIPSGTYYIACMYNGTTTRFNAHGMGRFPTRRVTGATFSTAFATTSLTITVPTTFTITDLPPIASLY